MSVRGPDVRRSRSFADCATSDIRPRPRHRQHPLPSPNDPLIATHVDHNRRCAGAGLFFRHTPNVKRRTHPPEVAGPGLHCARSQM